MLRNFRSLFNPFLNRNTENNMSDGVTLTRGAARELTKYLETPGWCPATSGHAYRAGAISERLQIALPANVPVPANPQNVTVAELGQIRAWLAEAIGETLDAREVVVATACITHHREKQQITPNIHFTRLLDYLGLKPTD